MSPLINLINDQLLTDGNNNSSLYWLCSPSSLQTGATNLWTGTEPGLAAHGRSRRDLRRAEGGRWGQQACCIPGTLLGRGLGCPDSQGVPMSRDWSICFWCACAVSLQSSGSPVGVLKQKRVRPLTSLLSIPVYQGYEKNLPLNRFVPFLDKCVLQWNRSLSH